MKTKVEGRRIFFVAGVAVVCLAAALTEASFGDITQDDAFISFRFAENLAAGNGLVYNVGERVEGYTNFLWTLLIAAAVKAGVAAPAAGRWFGVASSLVAIIFTALLARRYAGEYLGVVAAAMLAVNGDFLLEAAQGLETSLFVFLVTAAAWRAGEEYAAPDKKPWSAPLIILTFLTRPDGALVFAAALPFYLATARANPRRLAFWAGATAAAALAYEVWRLAYYGDFLPNTFYAKVGAQQTEFIYGLKYTVGFLLKITPVLLILPFAVRPRKVIYSWGALFGILVIYVVAVGGDMKPSVRFYQPIIPLILVAAAAAVRDIADSASALKRRALPFLAAAAVVTSFLQFLPGFFYARQYREPHELHVAAGTWLAENAPPDATLATTAAGIIPYYSGLYTIDMLGLTDRYIARHGKRTAALPGHELAATDYVLDKKPDFVLIYDLILTREPVSAEEVAQKTQLPASREMVASPRFRREYLMSHAEILPGTYFIYFVRAEPAPRRGGL
jgi:arabinofuranosyltransferase